MLALPPCTHTSMNCYFYLSRKRRNSRGLCPIYTRVVSNGYRKDFATGIFIAPEHWGEGWPKANVRDIPARLLVIHKRISAVIAECEGEGINCPTEAVYRYTSNIGFRKTLLSEILSEWLITEKPTALVREKTEKSIADFIALTGCNRVTQVVPETLRGMLNEARAKYKPTTISKKLWFIKRVFTFAENRGYIARNRNPFHFFKIPKVKAPPPVQLELCELQKLFEHNFASARLNYVRDLHRFAAFTGFSYGDMWQFGRHMVVVSAGRKFVTGNRAKWPHEAFYLPLLPEAEHIAEKYNYSFRQISNQKYNAYLKEVAQIVGIEKNLTTHVARKTFSQKMIDAGFTTEVVARMVGHKDFKMTQEHYARVAAKRVESEVMRLTG